MSAYAWVWVAIVAAGIASWLTKFAGHVVPERVVSDPRVHRVAAYVTVALLAALAAVQTFTTDGRLVIDARMAGLAAAVIALVLRAPFIAVVAVAALVTAAVRLWG